MKLLLTSAGLCNDSIRGALEELLQKPFGDARVCFVATASMAEGGDHGWFVDDLQRLSELGWRELDVLDLNIPKGMVLSRLERADVIYVEGGNTYYLAKSLVDNGLVDEFVQLLDRKVYVGVSAGSMIFSRDMTRRMLEFYDEEDEIYRLNGRQDVSPLGLFDWFLKPHIDFDTWKPVAKEFPYYAVDDQTAIQVVDGEVTVTSEGKWEFIEVGRDQIDYRINNV